MKNNRFKKIFLLSALLLAACDHANNYSAPASITSGAALPGASLSPAALTEAEQKFVTYVAPKYGVSSEEAAAILAQVKIQPSIIKTNMRPAEKKSWGVYRAALLTPQRISLGKKFMQDHATIFAEATKRYDVSPEIIAGIIGVESQYGQHLGNYRVLDALATLSFASPRRSAFFQKELAEYMSLIVKSRDFVKIKGSYAGAFGMPQFMPSSYLSTAVSNQPGKLANLDSPDDAILSVAHYFHMNGWQSQSPVAVRVKLAANSCHQLTCDQKKPLYSVTQWQAAGVQVPIQVDKILRASVVRLQTNSGEEDWMIFHNFYVITRYNSSINYAMAVFQLGQALREEN